MRIGFGAGWDEGTESHEWVFDVVFDDSKVGMKKMEQHEMSLAFMKMFFGMLAICLDDHHMLILCSSPFVIFHQVYAQPSQAFVTS